MDETEYRKQYDVLEREHSEKCFELRRKYELVGPLPDDYFIRRKEVWAEYDNKRKALSDEFFKSKL